MKNYKKYRFFTICFFLFAFLFIVFNYITWKVFTEKILSGINYGDLARIAYLPGFKKQRIDTLDLSSHHVQLGNFKGGSIDLLTIGDSFSQGCGGGRNRFYQDYIASIHNKTVVNASLMGHNDGDLHNPVRVLLLLLNGGILEDIKPKAVLLETSERFVYQRLATSLDLSARKSREELTGYCKAAAATPMVGDLPGLFFVNAGNMKFYYNSLIRWIRSRNPGLAKKIQKHISGISRVFGPPERLTPEIVGEVKLTKPLFSGNDGTTLLFTMDELYALPPNQPETAMLINANLNSIAELLGKKNIKLYFLMVPDKVNLYSDYLTEKPFAQSHLYELLEPMGKRYTFINTKKILRKELDSGNSVDLYHQDDTHWTWKASEAVAKSMVFK